MFSELWAVFLSDDPIAGMGKAFFKMLAISEEMMLEAGRLYFDEEPLEVGADHALYGKDRRVNELEVQIRKELVAHLCISAKSVDVTHCLTLMSLVKDVERLGDYAKNLYEAGLLRNGEPLPDTAHVGRLQGLREEVEGAFARTSTVFGSDDRPGAAALLEQGRDIARRCDALLAEVAGATTYSSGVAVSLALGSRYYKRFAAHLSNVLSSVVMPVHKLDTYDEDEISEVVGIGVGARISAGVEAAHKA